MERNIDLIDYDDMLHYYEDKIGFDDNTLNNLVQFDLPIKYKELIFYPVIMKMYVYFQTFTECLTLKQYRVANPKILQMKYLDFLFVKDKELNIDNTINIVKLQELLLICLRIPRSFKTINGEEKNTIDFIEIDGHWKIKIYNNVYDYKDFEIIRKIICEQNLIELPDPGLSIDIEKKYEEYIKFLKNTGKLNSGSIEDLSLCIMAETGMKREDVNNLTIRTFYKLIQRISFIMEYKITNILAPYLDKDTARKIPNWTDKIKERSKLEEMSTNLQEVENKIKSA